MAVVWTEALSTGVIAVDNQHKELFRQINALSEAMAQGKGRDHIARLLDFLGQYVVRHFADEEKAMQECACPAAAANKQAHAQLLAKFAQMRQRLDSSGASATFVLELQDTLLQWLTQHIKGIDTQLRGCVGKQPALCGSAH
jgi:hemerythrin